MNNSATYGILVFGECLPNFFLVLESFSGILLTFTFISLKFSLTLTLNFSRTSLAFSLFHSLIYSEP